MLTPPFRRVGDPLIPADALSDNLANAHIERANTSMDPQTRIDSLVALYRAAIEPEQPQAWRSRAVTEPLLVGAGL